MTLARLLFSVLLSALLGAGALAAIVATPAGATPSLAAAAIGAQQVASGLDQPVAIAFRQGDARMYVAEKTGHVRIVNTNHTLASTPVLSLTVATDGEEGLVGLVFSDDGTKMYVDYVSTDRSINVVEYTMSGDVANTATRRTLLIIDHHQYTNHNGGDLQFGPDGMLYISTGDGGGGGDPLHNGQNTNALLGKILRVNVTPDGGNPYTIPVDNPFHGRAGKRAEIWMYGLRNPWRFSFDKDTGEMWIADVGQNLFEEVDHANPAQLGTNWGWNAREGLHAYLGGARPPGAQDPLLETPHTDGSCAIIGGYVYRGHAIPNLNGAYLFSDNCRTQLVGAARNGNLLQDQRDMGVSLDSPTSFGEDASGDLYVASLSGRVYKLVPGSTQPVGYWQAAFDGRVFGYHSAISCNPSHASARAGVVGVAGTPFGYWTTSRAGVVAACHVPNYGSLAGKHLNKPIVGIASTPTGRGYWLVASDGGLFSFGDARFYGSTGATRLNKPVVGMAATPSGKGYWLVASDGGIFSFGDAHFYGSSGAMRLARPVIGMAATTSGRGYWLVAGDGGLFTFGPDARFFGSAPSRGIRTAVTGMAASPSGKGYWMTAANGATLVFGDARNWGNAQNARTIITGIADN